VFKGMKYGSYMVWPCRMVEKHKTYHLFQIGQQLCYNESGAIIDCHHTGQDGEFQSGMRYKKNRFTENGHIVYDKATGLTVQNIELSDASFILLKIFMVILHSCPKSTQ